MSRIIGYARVPRRDRTERESGLRAAGAVRVFVDEADPSRSTERVQWRACLDFLRAGDAVLVPRLDTLGGSERIVIEAITELHHRGADLRSLAEPVIDTTVPSGRTLFEVADLLAQTRTDHLREKTVHGLERARAEGRVGGRPSVMTPARLREARRLRAAGQSMARIALELGVGKSSVARALAREPRALPERRVFFRDVKPFEAPDSLDLLAGPPAGVMELPHHLYWGPVPTADLSSAQGVAKAYQAVITEGGPADQIALLDRELLMAVWPDLALPDRVRLLWEQRFPELLDRG